jgi:myosin heavy subunit
MENTTNVWVKDSLIIAACSLPARQGSKRRLPSSSTTPLRQQYSPSPFRGRGGAGKKIYYYNIIYIYWTCVYVSLFSFSNNISLISHNNNNNNNKPASSLTTTTSVQGSSLSSTTSWGWTRAYIVSSSSSTTTITTTTTPTKPGSSSSTSPFAALMDGSSSRRKPTPSVSTSAISEDDDTLSLTLRITEVGSEFYNSIIKVPNKHLGEGVVMANEMSSLEGTTISSHIHNVISDKENRFNPKFGLKNKRYSSSPTTTTTTATTTITCVSSNEYGTNTTATTNTTTVVLPPADLISLTHLHEPAVVYCLHQRYVANEIYTSTGPILIALNPFKDCKSLYSEETMKTYWERGEAISKGLLTTTNTNYSLSRRAVPPSSSSHNVTTSTKGRQHISNTYTTLDDGSKQLAVPLPPHVYATADDAFRSMMRNLEDQVANPNQTILVSGESGAGKTVTTKIIMQYLAKLSKRSVAAVVSRQVSARFEYISSPQGAQRSMKEPPPFPLSPASSGLLANTEQQVLQSNPILESFGNARTVRNDNSSRFGKFIELQFTNKGCLIGAHVDTYLLEKVRLIHQAAGERNYHIFYEIFAGASQSLKRKMLLDGYHAQDFKMTSNSGVYTRRDGVQDSDTYNSLMDAMDTMGFTSDETDHILSTTCALLHLSNLTFLEVSADDCRLDSRDPSLRAVTTLLGVTAEELEEALCFTTMNISAAGESLRKTLSQLKATKALEALLKATYGAMFKFLVQRINSLIACDKRKLAAKSSHSNDDISNTSFIGLLDIFGFESFDHNSFEQLCINYCNEALQQQFNRFVFKLEQQEYEREGELVCFVMLEFTKFKS